MKIHSPIPPGERDKLLINDDFLFDSTCLFDHNYSAEEIKNKFKIIGSYVVHGDVGCRPWIFVYGGSTTSAIQGSLWSAYLHQELASRSIDACIFNGGCASFNSWNELNKMTRDVPIFKPDIVISFGGINDYTVHVDKSNPYVNTRLLGEMQATGIFSGISNPPSPHDHADVFLTRAKCMHSICTTFGSKFIKIIQPTLGYGNYIYDESDPADNIFSQMSKMKDDYHDVPGLVRFYDKVRNTIVSGEYSYIYDMTNLFDGKSRLFKDFRHPNQDGYALIAKAISNLLSL